MQSPFLQKCLDMLQEREVQDKILLFIGSFIFITGLLIVF